MAAHLRIVKARQQPQPIGRAITVIPLYAELMRRPDLGREHCILYGLIVAMVRLGLPTTARALREQIGGGETASIYPYRSVHGRIGNVHERSMRRRLAALVHAGLLERDPHAGRATLYKPIGPTGDGPRLPLSG